MIPVVKFNNVDEFIQELELSPPDHGIVRATYIFTPSSISPNIRHVQVVATCFITREGDAEQIVRLEKYAGDLWGMGDVDERVMEKAEEAKSSLESKCRHLNLDVRGGMLESPAEA